MSAPLYLSEIPQNDILVLEQLCSAKRGENPLCLILDLPINI